MIKINNEKIIRTVWGAKKKGRDKDTKLITVPSQSDISVGDRVIIEKVK